MTARGATATTTVRDGLRYLARWFPLALLVGLLAGTASALLIWSLDVATRLRETHLWLIALLPLAGLLVGFLYLHYGGETGAGTNLILDEIHGEVEDPRKRIWFRMTPLILMGTFLTHLCGGSAGREGTAVQTGASLAYQLARPFRLGMRDRRVLLMCGVSAGFASVFGTPLAGTVFGMEIVAAGVLTYRAILPCVLGAWAADMVTRAWGVRHTAYAVKDAVPVGVKVMLLAAVAGIVFGLVARMFVAASHGLGKVFERRIRRAPLRPFVGGVIVAAAVAAIGSTRYVGLGIPVISSSFVAPQPVYDWAAKLAFTVVTLASGLKGGEVTPLFFIGATLGNALSHVLPLPASLLAAMGFAAVFGGAAKTPLCAALLAFEVFGADAAALVAVACASSYFVSGPVGVAAVKLGLQAAYRATTGSAAETHEPTAADGVHENIRNRAAD